MIYLRPCAGTFGMERRNHVTPMKVISTNIGT
jgi:hypothetical protein